MLNLTLPFVMSLTGFYVAVWEAVLWIGNVLMQIRIRIRLSALMPIRIPPINKARITKTISVYIMELYTARNLSYMYFLRKHVCINNELWYFKNKIIRSGFVSVFSIMMPIRPDPDPQLCWEEYFKLLTLAYCAQKNSIEKKKYLWRPS